MAMTAASLKGRIKTKIEAITDYPAIGQHPIFADERIILALAEAIVEEIQSNAKVQPGITLVAGAFPGATTGLGDIL